MKVESQLRLWSALRAVTLRRSAIVLSTGSESAVDESGPAIHGKPGTCFSLLPWFFVSIFVKTVDRAPGGFMLAPIPVGTNPFGTNRLF